MPMVHRRVSGPAVDRHCAASEVEQFDRIEFFAFRSESILRKGWLRNARDGERYGVPGPRIPASDLASPGSCLAVYQIPIPCPRRKGCEGRIELRASQVCRGRLLLPLRYTTLPIGGESRKGDLTYDPQTHHHVGEGRTISSKSLMLGNIPCRVSHSEWIRVVNLWHIRSIPGMCAHRKQGKHQRQQPRCHLHNGADPSSLVVNTHLKLEDGQDAW
ncbi:hypothetical protein N656DRAFT_424390 [Canariomyces notabilis]|uniref:Uncharacterized protein n=1 Tax=Canariomyces notabilis TaxID=2074819 RepID=A0AAN6QGY0_9PEZI|nr:hypothetical protein N656DRAFT_424390 [Canariomyces arenarius]